MKRLTVLVAVIVCLVGAAPALAQQGACTLKSLAGTYVFESRGSSALVTGPASLPNHLTAAYAPIIIVGRLTIAADGSADGFYWAMFGTGNPGVDPVPWHGEIHDFANCSGLITYQVPFAGLGGVMVRATERFVVVDGGRELRTVATEFVVLSDPPTPLTGTWNTTLHRVNNGNCGQPLVRGEWVLTCQSLHPLTSGPFTYAAEAAMIRAEVDADGDFTGSFETKIGPNHVTFPVSGSFEVGDACTLTGRMQSPAAPGNTIIAKGVIFGEGKEILLIPVANFDGTTTRLNAYDNCRAIRVGR